MKYFLILFSYLPAHPPRRQGLMLSLGLKKKSKKALRSKQNLTVSPLSSIELQYGNRIYLALLVKKSSYAIAPYYKWIGIKTFKHFRKKTDSQTWRRVSWKSGVHCDYIKSLGSSYHFVNSIDLITLIISYWKLNTEFH